MQTLRVALLTLALLALSALSTHAQVHASCVGPTPTGVGPVRAVADQLRLAFEYVDTDFAALSQGTMQFTRVGQTAVLSTQVVMASTITRLGGGNGAGIGCYSLPVVPVDQLPRGVPLLVRLSVSGGEPLLASDPSNPTDPFGRRLPAGVLRLAP